MHDTYSYTRLTKDKRMTDATKEAGLEKGSSVSATNQRP